MRILEQIEQGNIYYGFRSEKYPEVCCYAVIISARCDIANNKISKLYYLTAVDAKEWFCTKEGFECVYGVFLKEDLKNRISALGINVNVLLSFPEEMALKVIREKCREKKKRSSEETQITEIYRMVHQAFSNGATFENRKEVVSKINAGKSKGKQAISFLKGISKGDINHYHFIPRSAYTEKEDKVNGLIVDLQEIGILSFSDAQRIVGEGIDYYCLPSDSIEETNRLTHYYWLNDENDFVMKEGVIKSPWCELLLQRFALDFIRIGVDGSTESDYIKLVSLIGKG